MAVQSLTTRRTTTVKVTFILPDFRTTVAGYSGAFSHSVAYLSRYLKIAGHDADLLHVTRLPTKSEFQEQIVRRKPGLVGFSAIYHFFPLAEQWAGWSKEVSPAPVIFGGTYPTLDPETVISAPSIDMLCRGEAEEALPELCDALEQGREASSVRNIWHKRDGRVCRTELRPLITDLNGLEFPDYSVHGYDDLFFTRTNTLSVMISRGCPYGCHYCSSRALAGAYPEARRFYRFLSPERATELLVFLKKQYPRTERFVFNDSILFPKKSWLERFCVLYKKHVSLPFVGNCRPEGLDRDTARMLAEMGCSILCFGVESGNEHINSAVLGRRLTKERISRSFRTAHGAGIRTVAYSILGSPFETRSTMLETVKFAAELEPHIATPFIFYPFPGTEAHEMCRKSGFLTDRHFLNNDEGVMIEQPGITETDVLFFHAYYKRLVKAYIFLRRLPRPARDWLAGGLDRALLSDRLPRAALVRFKAVLRRVRWRLLLLRTAHSPARS